MKLETLANINCKKPTKAAAWAVFSEMVLHDDFSEAALAKLYQFFTPPLPAKPKDAWQWIAKAMGKNDIRYYLNYVYVTADTICATDGHRLHIMKNHSAFPVGYYDSNKVLAFPENYAKYPDITRVTPDIESGSSLYYCLPYDAESLKVQLLGTSSQEVAVFMLRDGTELGIDKGYFLQAIGLKGETMDLYVRDSTSSIILVSRESGNKAVIMPIKL